MLFMCRITVTFFTLSVVLIAIFYESLRFYYLKLLTEQEKCPGCYGLSMCQSIDSRELTLEFKGLVSIFNNLFGVKNIYYGKYKGQDVILKKLAHQSELDQFDELVCNKKRHLAELCAFGVTPKLERKPNYERMFLSEIFATDLNDPELKLTLCPFTNIFNLLKNLNLKKSALVAKDFYKYLYTTLKINPEPIVLRILKAKDGWPVPVYFGACGRLVVESYEGLELSSFFQEPWLRRAKIASSLLDAAYKFTFKSKEYAYYLADVSLDNISINNKDEAIFVDLENIIIVDRNPPEKIDAWHMTHVTQSFADCEDCFIFSANDICTYNVSDHNYWAICKHVLHAGLSKNRESRDFLHNIPEDIDKQYPDLRVLLKQCWNSDPSQSRIESGIKLKNLLDVIIANLFVPV